MKTGAYAEAVNSAGYGDQARPRGACHCAGCPMPGSLTTSTSGTQEWFCRLHFGAPAALWNDISARASNRADLLGAVHEAFQLAAGETRVPNSLLKALAVAKRQNLLTDLPPGSTSWVIARHVFGVLEHEIKHPELQPQMAEPLVIDEEYHA